MATIQKHIAVDAAPSAVGATWSRFIKWAHTGPGRLACDELACFDAVRAGLVRFDTSPSGGTLVVFSIEQMEGGPAADVLERHLGHDLVIFKDYVERGGVASGKPLPPEETVLELEADRHGDAPRHVRLSDESDSTFMISHFPA